MVLMERKRMWRVFIGAIAMTMLGIAGCQPVPKVKTPVSDDGHGTVYLETFEDPTFRARHPRSLDPSYIKAVFQRLFIRQEQELLATLLSEKPPDIRALTDTDIEFLKGPIVQAFEMATPEEYMAFRVIQNEGGNQTQSSGSMYFTDHGLVVAIHQYRTPVHPAANLSRPQPSFARAPRWTLHFQPENVVQREVVFPRGFTHDRPGSAVAINLDGLAKDPAAWPTIEDATSSSEGLAEKLEKTEQDVRRLQEEIRQLQHSHPQ